MRLPLLLCLMSLAAFADETGGVRGTVKVEGKARNLVVYVEKVAAKKKGPAKKATMGQKDLRFEPEVLVVREGVPVEFPNEDKVFHNAFSLSPGNDFDVGLYRGGVSRSTTFKTAGEVDVFCNIHPDMIGKVLVLQNDFFSPV